jgi:alpha-galactosidase
MTMPGEEEDALISGAALMNPGIRLKQAFSGTGYNEEVRHFQDFSARLYFMEKMPQP